MRIGIGKLISKYLWHRAGRLIMCDRCKCASAGANAVRCSPHKYVLRYRPCATSVKLMEYLVGKTLSEHIILFEKLYRMTRRNGARRMENVWWRNTNGRGGGGKGVNFERKKKYVKTFQKVPNGRQITRYLRLISPDSCPRNFSYSNLQPNNWFVTK